MAVRPVSIAGPFSFARIELLPQFAEPRDLLRRQNLSNRQLAGQPQLGQLGLRRLKVPEASVDLCLVDRVRVYRLIEMPVGFSNRAYRGLDSRPSFLVYGAYLLYLLRRQPKR